jgi:hypothetical protein
MLARKERGKKEEKTYRGPKRCDYRFGPQGGDELRDADMVRVWVVLGAMDGIKDWPVEFGLPLLVESPRGRDGNGNELRIYVCCRFNRIVVSRYCKKIVTWTIR